MAKVTCEEYLFTWAYRNLGPSGGFGPVRRSRGWQNRDALKLAPDVSVNLDISAGKGVHGVVRRMPDGNLLVAKTASGKDGKGRPGRFVTHALRDSQRLLGPLDLAYLVTIGLMPSFWDMNAAPQDNTESLMWDFPSAWDADTVAGYAASPLVDADLLERACAVVPATIVNGLEFPEQVRALVIGDTEGVGSGVADVLTKLAAARDLGMANTAIWWERRGLSNEQWAEVAGDFVLQRTDPSELDLSDLVRRFLSEHQGSSPEELWKRFAQGARPNFPRHLTPRECIDLLNARELTSTDWSEAVGWVSAATTTSGCFAVVSWAIRAGLGSDVPAFLGLPFRECDPRYVESDVQQWVLCTWALGPDKLPVSHAVHPAWWGMLVKSSIEMGNSNLTVLEPALGVPCLVDLARDVMAKAPADLCTHQRVERALGTSVADKVFVALGPEHISFWMSAVLSRRPPAVRRAAVVDVWPSLMRAHGWSFSLAELIAPRRPKRLVPNTRRLLTVVSLGIALALVIGFLIGSLLF